MATSVRDLADLVGGQVVGDGDVLITSAKPVKEAAPSDITFIENDKHANLLRGSRASAAVVSGAVAAGAMPEHIPLIKVPDALTAFVAIVRHLRGWVEAPPHGIDPLASVNPAARIGPDASIFPFVVIGAGAIVGARCKLHSGVAIGRNCRLGDDVTMHSNSVLYDDSLVGQRVIIHSNAVIGGDGFGYRQHDGRHVKVPQLGHVDIGDDVEIGSGSTIDRGTFGATRIGAGTKIDNLVQVGHNCQIGKHNLLCAQVGIGGSTTTGDHVVLAGQAGAYDHVNIGAGAMVGAQGGVVRDLPAGQRSLGNPALPERLQQRILVILEKLPQMRRVLLRIQKQLGIKDE